MWNNRFSLEQMRMNARITPMRTEKSRTRGLLFHFTIFGAAFAVTCLYQGMRPIMRLGGMVASGGPYAITHPAPSWVWILPVSNQSRQHGRGDRGDDPPARVEAGPGDPLAARANRGRRLNRPSFGEAVLIFRIMRFHVVDAIGFCTGLKDANGCDNVRIRSMGILPMNRRVLLALPPRARRP